MKIYYVLPDYIEDVVRTTENGNTFYSHNENDYKKLAREGKAEIYSIPTFVDAFNNDCISDMGVLFYSNNNEKFF